jgi:integrase
LRSAKLPHLLPESHLKRSPPLASNAAAAHLLNVIRTNHRDWFGMLAFLLLTGARRGEAAGLRWDDVDLGRRLVTIRQYFRRR